MRAIFGVMSLLIVLVVVGVLAKKQLGAFSAGPVQPQNPVLVERSVILPVAPGATPQVQSLQIQQQIKQSVETAMQQSRPIPDDQPKQVQKSALARMNSYYFSSI
jgi:hypothetical protein